MSVWPWTCKQCDIEYVTEDHRYCHRCGKKRPETDCANCNRVLARNRDLERWQKEITQEYLRLRDELKTHRNPKGVQNECP